MEYYELTLIDWSDGIELILIAGENLNFVQIEKKLLDISSNNFYVRLDMHLNNILKLTRSDFEERILNKF